MLILNIVATNLMAIFNPTENATKPVSEEFRKTIRKNLT